MHIVCTFVINASSVISGNMADISRNSIASSIQDTSANNSSEVSTPTAGRPKRAAATVATERMVLRRQAPKPVPIETPKPTTPKAPKTATKPRKSPPKSQSPAKKRRKRGTDATFNANNTTLSNEITVSPLRTTTKNNKPSPRRPVSHISRKRAGKNAVEEPYVRNLHGMLRTGEQTINAIVDSWVEVYKADRVMGYLELANLFIHTSGCHGNISYGMAGISHGEIIKQLIEKFNEVREF